MLSSLLLAVAVVSQPTGYDASLAGHLRRWLEGEKIPVRTVAPSQMGTQLAQEKVAFLVGLSNPSADEMRALKSFRARGGKLVVFHSASTALADLMDVKQNGYAAAPYPGAWSRMDFVSRVPEGLPSAIRQTSSVLLRAAPKPGKGRVLATWTDRRGRATGEPAWIATGGGYWMTHVLSADGDEDLKAQLVGALVGSVEPTRWSYAAHQARVEAKARELRSYAARQAPRQGEIRAVWDHSGCGLYPGNWPKTIALLKSAKVTDIFVNVAGAGFAHYPSTVLPRSKTFEQEGDQLAACVAAAKGSGIRVHAWLLAFTSSRATPDRVETFRRRGWLLKKTGGGFSEFLDPANPAVREYLLAAVAEMSSRYAVAGVHLDFVRWGEGTVRPADAAAHVTRFVADARRRAPRPKWLTAAVYGSYPKCVASVGQDWTAWLDAGVVDYVAPMDYTESTLKLTELLVQQASKASRARRTIVGIGVTANESRLDARQVIDQINLTRKFGFAGNALFDLDVTLEKQVLPYLSLGIWK